MFSDSKQIATDHQACLGPIVFEELVIMKSAWGPDLCDMAVWNALQVKGVNIFDFEEKLAEDISCVKRDRKLTLGKDGLELLD